MEKLRAENTKLQEQLEIHEINKEQMHMRVWLKNSEIKAVFIWVSKSIMGFASTALHDIPTVFAPFFHQSWLTRTGFPALCVSYMQLRLCPLWLVRMTTLVFLFTTLDWKLLYEEVSHAYEHISTNEG